MPPKIRQPTPLASTPSLFLKTKLFLLPLLRLLLLLRRLLALLPLFATYIICQRREEERERGREKRQAELPSHSHTWIAIGKVNGKAPNNTKQTESENLLHWQTARREWERVSERECCWHSHKDREKCLHTLALSHNRVDCSSDVRSPAPLPLPHALQPPNLLPLVLRPLSLIPRFSSSSLCKNTDQMIA